MSDFATVVIRAEGAYYVLTQSDDVLLRVPASVFERYDTDSVFPPGWKSSEDVHPVRRLYWNPRSLEFLMFGLDEQPMRFGDAFGPSGFRSFVQGFWLPAPPLLLVRPFWSPESPDQPFDTVARRQSYELQRAFLGVLGRLRPPDGWGAVLNAVDPYLDALGVNADGRAGDPDDLLELFLTPPAPLELPSVARALEVLVTQQAGGCVPVLRRGALQGVQAFGLRELQAAEAVLIERGIEYRQGPAFAH